MLNPDDQTPTEDESAVIKRLSDLLGDLSGSLARIAPMLGTAQGSTRAFLIDGLVSELGTLADLTLDTRNAVANLKESS